MAWTDRHPVLRVLFHGHVWLAVGAAAQLWWASGLLHLHPPPRSYGIVALVVFSGYGGMRSMRMKLPDLDTNSMMTWYRHQARTMWTLIIVSGLTAVFLAWPLRKVIFHALWLPALLSAAYILPLSVSRGRPWGLRRIPFLKAFIIGFVWACIVVVLPGAIDRPGASGDGAEVRWMAVIWSGYFTAIAIAFDIRDLPHDLPALRTVPQALGPRGAKVVANLLLVPLFLMLLALATNVHPHIEPGRRSLGIEPSLALPALGLIGTGILIAKSDPRRPWWYWEFLLDGSLILLPLLARVGQEL